MRTANTNNMSNIVGENIGAQQKGIHLFQVLVYGLGYVTNR
jgi:hypothetical protein